MTIDGDKVALIIRRIGVQQVAQIAVDRCTRLMRIVLGEIAQQRIGATICSIIRGRRGRDGNQGLLFQHRTIMRDLGLVDEMIE
jgi:hypothetical protein